MFNDQVHFWCKCNRYKPVTFKITCQSSQGHLLSRESIDLQGYCSCLLEKDQGQRFQVQTNRICILRFQTFLVPMQSQWKIWYLIPNELIYVLQRNSELQFLALTCFFKGTLNIWYFHRKSHVFICQRSCQPW